MKFRFPIVIIDEDFRSENASGLGIRALAAAIEKEGMEVLGVTSYGDLSQFAQQQSRASAFILSIDDEEFTPGPELDPAVLNLRKFIAEIRFKNAEIPIYLYGETRTSRHIPNDVLRELHGFIHMFEDTPEFVARHIIREVKILPRLARAAVLPRARRLRAGRLVLVALPRPLGRRRVPQEPGRPDVPPVLRREHAARRRLQLGRRAGAAARPLGPGRRRRAQRGAHLQRRPLLLRHQRHVDVEQDGLARERRARRHRGRRPQLPRVDPARDHDDRARSRSSCRRRATTSASSARFRSTSSTPTASRSGSRRTRSRARPRTRSRGS